MRTKKQMVQEWLKLAKEFRARAEAYGGNSDDRMKTGYCLGQSDVYLRLARELCNHSYIEIAGSDSVFACEICGVEDGSVLEE